MTKTDYSIKPLPGLVGVPGLNRTKDTDDRRKQKKSRRRPKADGAGRKKTIFDKTNKNEDGIDYCA